MKIKKKKIKKKNGFSIIELLIVIGVMGILVVIGGSLSSKIFARRSVDNITNSISSQLNLIKLRSSREGVEYRAFFDYDANDDIFEITTIRGDSNRNSNFPDPVPDANDSDSDNVLTTTSISVLDDYVIVLPADPITADPIITFTPTGNLQAGGTITIFPTAANALDANIEKCGVVTVNTLGRISTTIGRWDFAGNCRGISDIQDSGG